jgi:hypothetical protein
MNTVSADTLVWELMSANVPFEEACAAKCSCALPYPRTLFVEPQSCAPTLVFSLDNRHARREQSTKAGLLPMALMWCTPIWRTTGTKSLEFKKLAITGTH